MHSQHWHINDLFQRNVSYFWYVAALTNKLRSQKIGWIAVTPIILFNVRPGLKAIIVGLFGSSAEIFFMLIRT